MEETKVEEQNSPADGENKGSLSQSENTQSETNKIDWLKDACKNKKHIIPWIIVAILLATGGGFYYYKFMRGNLTQEAARKKVEDLISNAGLVKEGTKVEIKEVASENGLYKLVIELDGKQKVTTFLTRDGSKFFPNEPIDTNVEKKEAVAQEPEEVKEIPKADKPKVDLYVMSFCPFGNKAEDTLKPAYDLLKNKVDFNFHYIVQSNGDEILSLHGPKEATQNKREACVLKNYGKDKWFNFVSYVNKNCGSDGTCWETGAKNWGIAANKITACVDSEGIALMKENEKASGEAGADGSPTMLINGVETKVVYQYGNSDLYKQTICDSFNKAPAECKKKLSTETTTAQGGSCEN